MKTVAAAVALSDQRVFLARRALGQNLEGYWEFPGGKQEADETIQECIEREVREELALSCKAYEVISESVYEYESGAIRLIGVKVELDYEAEPHLTVHDRAEWVLISELMTYQLAPADMPLAQGLMNGSYR